MMGFTREQLFLIHEAIDDSNHVGCADILAEIKNYLVKYYKVKSYSQEHFNKVGVVVHKCEDCSKPTIDDFYTVIFDGDKKSVQVKGRHLYFVD